MTDYSNAVIYEINCKDNKITDTYIGSTRCFLTRESSHKNSVFKINTKLYRFIRSNFGWNNFNMVIIEKFSCKNKKQLQSREDFYINLWEPKLNTILPKPAEHFRLIKNKTNQKYYNSNKNKISEKGKKEIICSCGLTIKLSSKYRHLKSMKHKITLLSVENKNENK